MSTSVSTIRNENASEIFALASQSFRENLPSTKKAEFKEYPNAQSMLEDIQIIAENHPVHSSKLTGVVRKIHQFAESLEPYFRIVEIFVQVRPDSMALIWGSLRFIFKLCSNYITYLEDVANMFAQISEKLPAYEKYVDIIQKRAHDTVHSYPTLDKALANVYVDILQFCYTVCIHFSLRQQDWKWKMKASFIGQLLWKPVHAQHTDIVRNLDSHQKLLELELSSASTEEALRFFAEMEKKMEELRRQQTWSQNVEQSFEETERYAKSLQEWVNPPSWAGNFEQAQDRRFEGTCQWMMNDPRYSQWQAQVAGRNKNLANRILSIQAKPGFGKTILCAAIIEELGECVTDDGPEFVGTQYVPSVFHFFFDRRRESASRSAGALRAILAQILHLNRRNRNFIDTARSIKAKSKMGESTATDKEVVIVLGSLLLGVKKCFLVFDGLDECSDYAQLLIKITEIASEATSCGIVLSNRPNVQLLPSINTQCIKMNLTAMENTPDIELYLHKEISDLIDQGTLLTRQSLHEIVDSILSRSNEMFLWVKLLIEYLNLPMLTIRERREAVLHLNRLEGVDALYNAIFASLQKQFPNRAYTNFERIFNWVAYARRPLRTIELRTAIAIPLDRTHCTDDEIPNLENVIGTLTGSLIEIGRDGTVQFIHLSAHEYFAQDRTSVVDRDGEPITHVSVQVDIASTCLSYLCHSVISGPLSGESEVTPDSLIVERKYPFLSYAAGFWWQHLLSAIENVANKGSSLGVATWDQLTRLIYVFLVDRHKTNTVIEASWLFKVPVQNFAEETLIQALSKPIFKTPPLDSLSDGMMSVAQLLSDLVLLNKSWYHVLESEPNEIWEPSIPAFNKSRFWDGTSKAQVTQIIDAKPDTAQSITIHSRISESGLEMGIIRLFPPGEWHNACSLQELRRSQWKARYELWSIATSRNIYSKDIELPSQKVLYFLTFPKPDENDEGSSYLPEFIDRDSEGSLSNNDSAERDRSPTVSLPVAISSDTRRAVILDSILSLHPKKYEESKSPMSDETSQLEAHLQTLRVPSGARYIPFRTDISPQDWAWEPYYYIKFSPSGKEVVFVWESESKARKDNVLYGKLWWLQIHTDANFSRQELRPEYNGNVASMFFSVPEISCLSPCRGLAFHPSLPRLAFPQVYDGLPQTFIWDFEDPVDSTSNPRPIHDPPIVDPYFVEEGDYLCGTDAPLEFGFTENKRLRDFCTPIIAKIPEYSPSCNSRSNPDVDDDTNKNNGIDHDDDTSSPEQNILVTATPAQKGLSKKAVMELANRTTPHVQHANSLIFEKHSGDSVIHVSQLHQIEKEGAVVLRTFGTNGELEASTLSRLPNNVKECVDVSLLHSTEGESKSPSSKSDASAAKDDSVYIVLNKAHQKYYTPSDIGDNSLPAIIERDKESIPSILRTERMLELRGLNNDFKSLQFFNDPNN